MGKLLCLVIEVGFHQSERIDAFHIAENTEKTSVPKNTDRSRGNGVPQQGWLESSHPGLYT